MTEKIHAVWCESKESSLPILLSVSGGVCSGGAIACPAVILGQDTCSLGKDVVPAICLISFFPSMTLRHCGLGRSATTRNSGASSVGSDEAALKLDRFSPNRLLVVRKFKMKQKQNSRKKSRYDKRTQH